MSAQPYVVDLGGAHAVVVPDWYAYCPSLGYYCGKTKFDGVLARGADLYVLCHDADRAARLHDDLVRYPSSAAHDISVGRSPTYAPLVEQLRTDGHAVACDALGPDCDDERLKALHPPPSGPHLDFQWIAKEKRYRLRCLSEGADGAVSSQRIVLEAGASWEEGLRKGYARFARKKPPAAGLTCLPHVAAALARMSQHASSRLALWRKAMEAAGKDLHHDVRPFLVAADDIGEPGALLSVEIKGVRGSYLLHSDCRYRGCTSIVDRELDLRATLPETAIAGLPGSPASVIWGDADLSAMTILRPAKTDGIGFVLGGRVQPLPMPAPEPEDDSQAVAALSAMADLDLRIEESVLVLLSNLPASVRLHIYRTLLCRDEVRLDVAQWIDGTTGPFVLARDGVVIRIHSSTWRSTTDGISL